MTGVELALEAERLRSARRIVLLRIPLAPLSQPDHAERAVACGRLRPLAAWTWCARPRRGLKTPRPPARERERKAGG